MTLSIPDKAKVNAKHYTELCYPDKLNSASLSYRLVSFPSRTVGVLTLQSWLKTGLPSTAVNFFGKDEWPPNSPDINPLDLIITFGELCLNTTRHFIPSQRTVMDQRKPCS